MAEENQKLVHELNVVEAINREKMAEKDQQLNKVQGKYGKKEGELK